MSLSRWLPGVLLGVGLLFALVLALKLQHDFAREVYAAAERTARAELERTGRALEPALWHGEVDTRSVIAELEPDAAVQYAALIDDAGQVLASTRRSWNGHDAAATLPAYPLAAVRQVQQGGQVILQLAADRRHLKALGPVLLASPGGQPQARRYGLLLIEYDLSGRIAGAWAAVREQALVFGSTMALVILALFGLARWVIVRPATALCEGMRRIGAGDFASLPRLRGSGKFRVMGDIMQRMAADIQARKHTLEASERRFRELADASFEAVVVHEQGRITNANAAAERLLGVPGRSLVGRDLMTVLAPGEHERVRERFRKRINGIWLIDVLDGSGHVVPAEVSVRHVEIDGRTVTMASLRDLRERLAAQAEISRLAHFDPLTGLCGRHFLLARVSEQLAECRIHARRAALITVNVVGFQAVNDSLGMEAGDAVLRTLARRLVALEQRSQTLARLHGDHFALLAGDLPNDLDQASTRAARSAEQLLAAIAEPMEVEGQLLHLSATAGLVMFPHENRDAFELLRAAETAMHQADRRGPGQIHFFSAELQQAATARLILRNDLKRALQTRDQLVLHYQPQVDAGGGLVGVEALVRWRHPARGLVSPGEFIAEAEASGLIMPLGNWVLEEALACLRRWRASADSAAWAAELVVGVNVSPRQFREADFVTRVEVALERAQLDGRSLELELTESVLVDNLEATLEKMALLRRHGVRFALDDFGTGYSSLSYLKRLPIDTLKIDRSFVSDIDAPQQAAIGKRPAALIEAIVTMGHQLGLRVLAEGVETENQMVRLLRAGCDTFQGYRFSPALDEARLRDWAHRHRPPSWQAGHSAVA